MPASSAYWRIASARSFLHVQLHLVKSTGTAIVISFFRHLGGTAAQSIVLRALKSLETVSINDLLPALKHYIADSGMPTEEFRKRPVLNALLLHISRSTPCGCWRAITRSAAGTIRQVFILPDHSVFESHEPRQDRPKPST
jgi:hypothetical protein